MTVESVHNSVQDAQSTLSKEKLIGYTPAPARVNRPFKKRKISTFNVILTLVLSAIVSVLYISNIIAVNQLAAEIGDLKSAYSTIESANEILRLETNRKSSMDRITRIAAERMNMMYPQQPPIWFEVENGHRVLE